VARDLVVSVPTPAGTVELRGTGSESVLCLRGGDALSCAAAEHPDPNSPPDGGNFDGQWMATVPTEDGDQLAAVSDMGPILMQVSSMDEDEDREVFMYPDAEEGEADGSWAAVLPTPREDVGYTVPSPTWPRCRGLPQHARQRAEPGRGPSRPKKTASAPRAAARLPCTRSAGS
jgi:hypothetical protein